MLAIAFSSDPVQPSAARHSCGRGCNVCPRSLTNICLLVHQILYSLLWVSNFSLWDLQRVKTSHIHSMYTEQPVSYLLVCVACLYVIDHGVCVSCVYGLDRSTKTLSMLWCDCRQPDKLRVVWIRRDRRHSTKVLIKEEWCVIHSEVKVCSAKRRIQSGQSHSEVGNVVCFLSAPQLASGD